MDEEKTDKTLLAVGVKAKPCTECGYDLYALLERTVIWGGFILRRLKCMKCGNEFWDEARTGI